MAFQARVEWSASLILVMLSLVSFMRHKKLTIKINATFRQQGL
jgi:hypothetical protein